MFEAKVAPEASFGEIEKKPDEIEAEYYKLSLPKQMLFADIYAHKKFFWDHQIDWLDEFKKFRLFRDKIPFSAYVLIIVLSAAVFFSYRYGAPGPNPCEAVSPPSAAHVKN